VVTEPRGELAELYVRHVPAANQLGFLLTGDRSQAEDLVAFPGDLACDQGAAEALGTDAEQGYRRVPRDGG
jgi:hypothetical protein